MEKLLDWSKPSGNMIAVTHGFMEFFYHGFDSYEAVLRGVDALRRAEVKHDA